MKRFHWRGDNRGSVTILAIGIMAFLGIILSGVMPMITQEVRIGTMNRDVVEAQYAAESGLKRAIAGLETGGTSWAWIGQTLQFTSEAGKTYMVSVQNTSPQTLTNGIAPVAGDYYLQALGKVGNASKTVSVKVKLTTAGLSGVFTNGVFGNSSVNANSSTINGSTATNGRFIGYNAKINGNLTVVGQNNSTDTYQKVSVTGTTTDSTSTPAAQRTSVPTFSTTFTMPSSAGASAWTIGNSIWNNNSINVSSGKYYYSGALKIGKSTVNVQENSTLFFSGMEVGNASTLTLGNNAVLCIDGDLKITGNVASTLKTLGVSTIYVTKNLTIDNASSLELGGDTVVYVGGKLSLSNNSSKISTATGSNVIFKVNSISMSNATSIISGTGASLALLAETTISLSNTASINDAIVIAKGNIDLRGDGPTTVTGTLISTGGTVTLYKADVTYDADVVSAVLTNNPGLFSGVGSVGGGGANTVTTTEWKNI